MMGLIQFGLRGAGIVAALFPLQPPEASSIAGDVDHLYFFLTGITVFFSVLIFSIIFYFMVKYRRRSDDELPEDVHAPMALELAWTIIPSLICVVLFVWASSLYVRNSHPPAASTEIFVIGKQWMWHLQHPEGPREIDELHVPAGEPIKLTMTSQDVIHGFSIPAFRIKKDVLPGRYTSIWFEANEPGTYHLFCTEFCGTNHSEMIGWIYVMPRADYEAWLAGGEKSEPMAQQGEEIFNHYTCGYCHVADGSGRGPSLVGVYGKPEKLATGEMRMVDETLIRQALTEPNSVHLDGYAPIMPTFQGQFTEEQILQLIAYVKSLGAEERTKAK
ncbi:MAG: cytochrome c oxidase subunit II [Candidatus Acidiferrales bacterium]